MSNNDLDTLRRLADRETGKLMQRHLEYIERELKLQEVSGFSSEQLIDLFLLGYSLEPPEDINLEQSIKRLAEKRGDRDNEIIATMREIVLAHNALCDKECAGDESAGIPACQLDAKME